MTGKLLIVKLKLFIYLIKKNPNHFLCVSITWKPANHGDPFFKFLWDFGKKIEQVFLFVGYVPWVYLQPKEPRG
jgi:hypothetical protein